LRTFKSAEAYGHFAQRVQSINRFILDADTEGVLQSSLNMPTLPVEQYCHKEPCFGARNWTMRPSWSPSGMETRSWTKFWLNVPSRQSV